MLPPQHIKIAHLKTDLMHAITEALPPLGPRTPSTKAVPSPRPETPPPWRWPLTPPPPAPPPAPQPPAPKPLAAPPRPSRRTAPGRSQETSEQKQRKAKEETSLKVKKERDFKGKAVKVEKESSESESVGQDAAGAYSCVCSPVTPRSSISKPATDSTSRPSPTSPGSLDSEQNAYMPLTEDAYSDSVLARTVGIGCHTTARPRMPRTPTSSATKREPPRRSPA